ncbi:PAS domain-containing protein [Methanocella arvoryzae]|uniref:histidine kinase n=1 Tax=Methanocella arvoryzae (strain DSM 22066 / NBRC 105507 / MRE50) TaxID=351160 RepID=Q0W103_METAR|nr:PAS domain S-box protein [Methanocella arvoryzae]CAJ37940.1 putative signal transduction histidine kinase [Methanocella arvoryzae MRE50]
MSAILNYMARRFLDLSELGEFTAAAVENDTVSFIAAYADGSTFTCNLAFCKLTGYSKDEVSRMKWPEDFTKSEYRAQAIDLIKGVFCNVAPYTYELELVRKDGSPVPVDVYVHKFCDEAGTTQYLYSFITDMTEHKRLENALRASERKYRELVENANSIILKMDLNGNITFFNEFAQKFFRFELNEILGKNVMGTIVPIKESTGRNLTQMIRDIYDHPQKYVTNENENMRSNGERVWISWTNKAIMDEQGNIVGVLSVGNDITALKHTESELKKSRDELEARVKERTAELERVNKFLLDEIEARKRAEQVTVESEEKFRILVETAPLAIFFHRGISFIYANPAAERITGLSADEIKKVKFWELFAPEFRDMVRERGLAMLRGEDSPYSYEVRLQTTGAEKWMEITSTRVTYKGNPAILTIGQDITQYRETMIALHNSKVEAELYVDLMSHDINNINQAGMGNLELLKNEAKLNEYEQERVANALAAFENSSELIDNVKKLKKAKDHKLKIEKIDLGPVLDEVRNKYLATPGRDVTINFEPRSGCYVNADSMIYDVFSNLVGNSIKHSEGAVVITINLNSAVINNEKYYRVSIEDNGPGIEPDLKTRIFNRIYYEGGIMRGKGIGLYLVKVLVECYHGGIIVEDRVPGDYTKGARFIVILPAADK